MENVCQGEEHLLYFRDQVAYPQQIREMAQENQSQKLRQWMVIKTTFHPKLRTWMKLVKESADENGITPTDPTVLTASRKSLLLIHAL